MIGVYLWEFFMDFIWGWFGLGFFWMTCEKV